MSPPPKDEWTGDTDSVKAGEEGGDAVPEEDAFPASTTVVTKPSFAVAPKVIPLNAAKSEPRPHPAPSPARVLASAPARAAAPRPDGRLSKLKSLEMNGDGPSTAAAPRRGWGLPFALLLLACLGMGGYLAAQRYGWIGGGSPGRGASSGGDGNPGAMRFLVLRPVTRATSTVSAAGYINAKEPIVIGSTVSGRVSRVLVANGDTVTQGQLLVQIDDGELRAELSLAGARLRAKTAELNRIKKLVKAEVATTSEYERVHGEVDVARAEVGIIYPKLKQMKIVAPTTGTVIEVLTKPGEVLTASAASAVGVVKLADLSQLVAEVDVNEADIALLRRGDNVEVTVESVADKTFTGKVAEVAGQADRARGTVLVKVALPPDPKLRPGLTAKAQFQGSSAPTPRLLAPRSALDGESLWVAVDGRAHKRAVVKKSAGADQIEIESGVREGDKLILAGWQSLADGDRVTE